MSCIRKDFSAAVEMYNSGMSIGDIAYAHGVSRQSMHEVLRIRGVAFRSQLRFGTENHFYREGVEYDTRVRNIVMKAIQSGKLVPRPCEVCGITGFQKDGRNKIEAHHDDYNKPLSVRWLCQPHHHEWHKHNKPIRRTSPIQVMSRKEAARLGGLAPRKEKRETS